MNGDFFFLSFAGEVARGAEGAVTLASLAYASRDTPSRLRRTSPAKLGESAGQEQFPC
jgi:hypothetical protein